MVVLRSNRKGIIGCYDPSLDRSVRSSSPSNSKRLRSTESNWPDPEYLVKNPIKKRKYTAEQVRDATRPYVDDALRFYNKEAGTNYKLVEPGYLTSVLLRTCILHHIDFTAKETDVADAPEEMFFAELTTPREDVLEATSGENRWVKFCKNMGAKDLISGDKRNGCCYCRDENVQHPKGGGFSRGGRGLFRDDESDPSLDGFKCLRSRVVPARSPVEYMVEALCLYNSRLGSKYELVEPGCITKVLLETCTLYHVNFTAKKTDVADAPEVMFFAELTTTCGVPSFNLCKCMGPRDSISDYSYDL
ncbi:hypothetical protein C5167_042722 [Papaver somniferum]|uniref:DUF3615 domain-containing protein n=1 Tax=Papaver somniferum TaxID=3469 RepID=A0A4Y7L4N7_PAPSO|nr:uncharacterized protein LOC113317060 isoform X2 [Papaver somniferum]RZC80146.1 hypothetical protein C5167_042722 [Papaver somniferum]